MARVHAGRAHRPPTRAVLGMSDQRSPLLSDPGPTSGTPQGLLRPSFVPPAEIRQLRDYTRLRVDLTSPRSTTAWKAATSTTKSS